MSGAMRLCPKLQQMLRLLLGVLFGLTVRGRENVPRRGGIIIACNHISNLDPPVLGSAVPRPVSFMAKSELFTTGAGAFFMPRLGAFPVNRRGVDTDALRTALAELDGGKAVIVFPEGTRSHDGKMLPLKAGIGLIAARAGVPVVPAFIWGTDNPGRALARSPRFTVGFDRPIPYSELAGAGGARKTTERIGAGIAGLGARLVPGLDTA